MQGMGAGKTTRTVVVVKLGQNSNRMRAGGGFSPLAVGGVRRFCFLMQWPCVNCSFKCFFNLRCINAVLTWPNLASMSVSEKNSHGFKSEIDEIWSFKRLILLKKQQRPNRKQLQALWDCRRNTKYHRRSRFKRLRLWKKQQISK